MESEEIESWIKGIPVGMNWGTSFGNNAHLYVYNMDGVYLMRASWKVNEKYDEDPQSVMCGCPLQGQSHMHQEREYHTEEIHDLIRDYIAALERMSQNKHPEFAESHRIGEH